jgi:hypothetical protein
LIGRFSSPYEIVESRSAGTQEDEILYAPGAAAPGEVVFRRSDVAGVAFDDDRHAWIS